MDGDVEDQSPEANATNHMIFLIPDAVVDERPECRVGRCKLPCLDSCATVRRFLFLFYILMFVQGIHDSYSIGILATLEKLYGLPSSKSAFIVSAPAVGYVLSVGVVCFLGRSFSTPKIFSAAAFLDSIAGFVTMLPHFWYGTNLNLQSDLRMHPSSLSPQFCNQSRYVIANSSASDSACAISSGREFNLAAYSMLVFGRVLHGISCSPVVPFGIPFVRRALDQKKASLLTGILFAVRLFALAIANLLSAFLLTIFVSLSGSTMTPRHPQWVGAWWLWYLVSAVASLLLAVLMVACPASLRDESITRPTQAEETSDPRSMDRKAELLPFVKSLHVNTMFLLLIAGFCCSVMAASSVAFLPKYMELYFRQPVSQANIIAGAGPLLAIAVSIITSLLLESRLQFKSTRTLRVVPILAVCVCLSYGLMASYSCPAVSMAGSINRQCVNFTLPCNRECACATDSFDPVCGYSGATYYSPCFAGCRHKARGQSRKTMTYTNCSCEESGMVTTSGVCGNNCAMTIPYGAQLFATYFAGSIMSVPLLNELLRTVKVEEHSLAIGILGLVTGVVLACAPIIYGSVMDSTCIQFRASHMTAGACQFYDTAKLHYKLQGLSAAFAGLASAIYICAWWIWRRRMKKQRAAKKTTAVGQQATAIPPESDVELEEIRRMIDANDNDKPANIYRRF